MSADPEDVALQESRCQKSGYDLATAQVDYYQPNPHKHQEPCGRCLRRLESLLALYGIENRERRPCGAREK